ncbi:primosomal protein N' [Porifericola rhodea]|uniref:replication restart helicase PriA n=1 Tax=Porifericola rhodea TaxID=930972 RepID=UPI0026668B9D|nr:primosomal protein N' [Porifericola rhodea]WKN33979.1 primosomal protein N' [Porifericola rhodea]
MLPVPIPKLFTYRIPVDMEQQVQIGSRVIVQFGSKKILTGVIGKLHQNPPQKYQARYILEVLDEQAVVHPIQLKHFQWIADYYACTVGEVLNVALPSGLKLSSESKVQLNPEFDLEEFDGDLNDKEYKILEALEEKQTLTYNDIGNLLEEKNFYHVIKSLIRKEAILIFEEVKEKYKPKIVKRVRLQPKYAHDEVSLENIFQELEKKPKQLDVLLRYAQLKPDFQKQESNEKGLLKSSLNNESVSTSSVNTLIKNGILEEFEEVVSRFQPVAPTQEAKIELTDSQQQAKDQILAQFNEKDTVLLHGVTGSGKTEIYIDLIQDVLSSGGQVLYLLPEIALTTQIVYRLKKIFGDQMGIYHSKFSDNERVEVWQGILDGRYPLVVGVRSAVLLPFENLGLIIVDEEHEISYKQFDPAPRYHARDVALVLAKMHHAKALLGSATPSVESYYNAVQGKYGLVSLNKRFGNAQLPEIELVDIRKEKKRRTMREDFSSVLLQQMEAVLGLKEQVIIFQNRRGYSPYILCEDCGHIPKCNQCDVSLTYHQFAYELRCHYCGHHEKLHLECEACGSTKLKTAGYGTEKLEEEIQMLIPDARVQRMDLDTTRKKNSYQQIIDAFAKREMDILVGTQMVSKGLDFDGVSLVGILDADRMIHFPDFRSHERTFQLITQVSGRSGRRDKVGKVIIQTTNLEQPILHKIVSNDYIGLYQEEIAERQEYHYPPFVRLIRITIKNPDKTSCNRAAKQLSENLREVLGNQRVLGPEEPLISRLRNQYLMQLMIKLERNQSFIQKAKKIIIEACNILEKDKQLKRTSTVIDVDPF